MATQFQEYLTALRRPFQKLCRVRFLQPNGATAFAVDNNPHKMLNRAFIADGSISANLQNGTRRTANVTFDSVGDTFDYNINRIWFGTEIAIDEGLILPDGTEFYIQQGVFLPDNPTETLQPTNRTITYALTDKWAELDGTLYGNLESTYEVKVNTNIFAPIVALLRQDRGNGRLVDAVTPIFTEWYNGRTQKLPNGSTVSVLNTPYTLTVDSTYAEVILGLAEMLNAWVGYDPSGALRIDASQDDILDNAKPVQWQFSTAETQFLGATYTVKNRDVYNDYIVTGEMSDTYAQPSGRAQNLDPSSDTNVNQIGRKTYRMNAAGYTTTQQCQDRAVWELKRSAVLQKSVTISSSQMFHIRENELVTLVRTDKPGSPVERHLVQGFSRPLTGSGEMTLNVVSVQDFPIATVTAWPE